MKSTRRQELHTNDLSQQIDQIRNYVKKHQTLVTVILMGIAVLLFGGMWYYNQQTSRLTEGWEKIGPSQPDDDVATLLDRYRAVAHQQINAALTTSAWLRLGNLSLTELETPKQDAGDSADTDSTNHPSRDELISTVREAFSKVLSIAPSDLTACGQSMIALGILAEDEHDFEKARQWYEKVIKDGRFDDTPFKIQADYRLSGLNTWSSAIEFPPGPPMKLVTPEDQAAGGQSDFTIKSIDIPTTSQPSSGSNRTTIVTTSQPAASASKTNVNGLSKEPQSMPPSTRPPVEEPKSNPPS